MTVKTTTEALVFKDIKMNVCIICYVMAFFAFLSSQDSKYVRQALDDKQK